MFHHPRLDAYHPLHPVRVGGLSAVSASMPNRSRRVRRPRGHPGRARRRATTADPERGPERRHHGRPVVSASPEAQGAKGCNVPTVL